MKSIFSTRFFNLSFLLFCALSCILIVSSCNKDDDGGDGDAEVIASFQFSVDAANPLTVNFINYSQNASSHAWDFGDGNTSTETTTSHTYAEYGTYEVTLTATGADGSTSSQSKTVTLTDPEGAASLLAGASSKTWYLQREDVALGIGPVVGDYQWWGFGINAPLGDRPCVLDDKYTFTQAGKFEFDSNNTIYIDDTSVGGWIDGNTGGCFEETTENLTSFTGEDLSSYGSGGDYNYTYDPSTSQLTIDGLGAYIGLCNKTELGDNYVPQTTKTYFVNKLVEGDVADTLQLAILALDGSFTWTFNLVSYENEADLPEIPASTPTASFSYTNEGTTYAFQNFSSNSTSYSWDFGDGNTSTEENPTHTFAGEGEYVVTLVASDDEGNLDTTTQTIIISNAEFSSAALSSAEGKVWRLINDNDAYVVGPAPGSGEWYAVDAATMAARECQTNDEFIFFDNGDFNYDAKGDVFADEFMCGPVDCIAEADIAAGFESFGSGNHSFSISGEGTDATITVSGLGAFIGFNKGFNGGEVSCADGNVASEITYNVIDYASVGGKEVITVAVDISGTGGAWWTMKLESE